MHFVTFIVKNLTRRPVRSGLTVLGLAATVASVIALLGVSHNIRRAVESSFEQRRIDLQVMQAGKSTGLNSDVGEYLAEEARKLPDGEAAAAGAVVLREDGRKLPGMRVSGFSVRVRGGPDHDARVEQVRRQLEALRDPDDPSVRLAAQSPAEFVRSLSQLQLVRAISWMVSVI